MGGGNVPENALSRICLDPSKRASALLCRGLLYRKNRALTLEGGGKRTIRGRVQNRFWEGIIREVFHPPHFSTSHGTGDFHRTNRTGPRDGCDPKVEVPRQMYFCLLGFFGIAKGSSVSWVAKFNGRLIYYHYWCWRVRGAVPVKTSTGNNVPRKCQRIPRNYCQYWCWILATFLPFSTGTGNFFVSEFKGDKNSECKLSNGWSRSRKVIKAASFCTEMSGREVRGR